MQRCIPSVDGEKIGAAAVVRSGTGTELWSSYTEVHIERSDRGALIKLINLGATSQFRNEKRLAEKNSRQLLGTEVKVKGSDRIRYILGLKCKTFLTLKLASE
jgi:hypothetical protein